MKKNCISIPEGLQLPDEAETKPFELKGMFLKKGDELVAVDIGGYPIPSDEDGEEDEMEEETEESSDDGDKGDEKPEESTKDRADSFIIAIERALAKPAK